MRKEVLEIHEGRHNLWLTEKACILLNRRKKLCSTMSRHNRSFSHIICDSIEDSLGKDDVSSLEEEKIRISQKATLQMEAIDKMIKSLIYKKEVEKEAELTNAFKAKPTEG